MVADYYAVEEGTIRQIRVRHKEELENDGLKVIKGSDLNTIKMGCYMMSQLLTVIPKRAILRIGMLLRDSEVAKQIRTYLLNVEGTATKENKTKASERHLGTWTSKEELILMDSFYNVVGNGGTLTEAMIAASSKMDNNHSSSACMQRYQNKLRLIVSNEKMLENIKNSKGKPKTKLTLVPEVSITIEDSEKSIKNDNVINKVDEMNNNMINYFESQNNKSNKLISDNSKLLQDKNDLSIELHKVKYESKLKDMVIQENNKVIKAMRDEKDRIVSEKNLEIKRVTKIGLRYKGMLDDIKKIMNPESQTKGKSKPAVQQQSDRSGKSFRIVDGTPVFEK